MINCYVLNSLYITRQISSFPRKNAMGVKDDEAVQHNAAASPKRCYDFELIDVTDKYLDKNVDSFNDINKQIVDLVKTTCHYNKINNAIFMSNDIDSVLFKNIVINGVDIYLFLQINNGRYELLCYLFNDEENNGIHEIKITEIKQLFIDYRNDLYNYLDALDINHEFYDNKNKMELLDLAKNIDALAVEQYFGIDFNL